MSTFPSALASRLTNPDPTVVNQIYLGGYFLQENYLPGTEIRNAIDYAWGETQKWGGVSATAILVLLIPAVGIWKNYRVDQQQKNKGTVI